MTATRYRLVLNNCPRHGYWAVSLDDEDGGIRLTSGKCCGRWDTVRSWPMGAHELRGLIEAATDALEEVDAALSAQGTDGGQ